MTFHELSTYLLAAAVIVWILVRQFRWKPVDPTRLWRAPVVLAAIGVCLMAGAVQHLAGAEIGLLVLELVVAGASGLLLGRVAELRRLDPSRPAGISRRGPSASRRPATHESRTGATGLLAWLGLILLRIGIVALGSCLGLSLAAGAGVVYLMIAANRAGRVAVLVRRLARPR